MFPVVFRLRWIAPTRVNDQYLTNVLLKINAKLGGLNSFLAVEYSPSVPSVSKAPTIILGMDLSHGSPGQSDIPSIAAVVSSRQWPLNSKHRASVRTRSPKVEMTDSLFERVSETEDDGIIRELLLDFCMSSGKRKPDQIIIFRQSQGAFGNMCRGGHMFAPTKIWHRKVNLNVKRYAVASAIAASAVASPVLARGHRIESVPELPLVISDSAEIVEKTSAALKVLKQIGAYPDVEKAKDSLGIRPGEGKMRNRRHINRKGPLIVYRTECATFLVLIS